MTALLCYMALTPWPIPVRHCVALSGDRLTKAVVLEADGSGNAPSRSPEFLYEVKSVVERGIVVLVVPQPLDGEVSFVRYAAGRSLAGVGAISGRDLPTEAAVTRLYYLLACGFDSAEIAAQLSSHVAAG